MSNVSPPTYLTVWRFLLAEGMDVEVRFTGGKVLGDHVAALQEYLAVTRKVLDAAPGSIVAQRGDAAV